MDETASYPGAIKEVIDFFVRSDVGIIQMPCPEFLCLGLVRGNPEGNLLPIVQENTRIRKLMEISPSIDKIKIIVKDVISQITDYHKLGFSIRGIVGINRSPTCGVNTTSDNDKEVEGEGVFMRELRESLEQNKLYVKMLGIKAFEAEDIKIKMKNILDIDI
jgi:predicted secreted protein